MLQIILFYLLFITYFIFKNNVISSEIENQIKCSFLSVNLNLKKKQAGFLQITMLIFGYFWYLLVILEMF